MKLSIITTVTNPDKRQDAWREAISCYLDLADEVIVVNGGNYDDLGWILLDENEHRRLDKLKVINMPWPEEWSWEELPKHLNAGLKEATGDWVIKMDIDQMFHEKDFKEIRSRLEDFPVMVATFNKLSVYPYKKYSQKSEMFVALNQNMIGKLNEEIKFGQVMNKDTDLCTPIRVKGKNNKGVLVGEELLDNEIGKTGMKIWNFDYTFKTKDVSLKEYLRFSKAYKRYFGKTNWGETLEASSKVFLTAMKDRVKQSEYTITDLDTLPKYIKQKYKDLTPEQFGYNGWGALKI